MNALFSDTDPGLEELQLQLIRRMPAWKKLAIVDDLSKTVRTLAISGIKQRHPAATPAEVQRMLAELMLGDELARKVYICTPRSARRWQGSPICCPPASWGNDG